MLSNATLSRDIHRVIPRLLISCILLSTMLLTLACEEENKAVLSPLRSPSELIYAPHCIANTASVTGAWVDVEKCAELNGTLVRSIYVANLGNATLGVLNADESSVQAIDVNEGVPGITGIRIADRPNSLAANPTGTIIIATSTLNAELSLISVPQQREIYHENLDFTPVRVFFDKLNDAFLFFGKNGSTRFLKLSFTCGSSAQNTYMTGCSLAADNLSRNWSNGPSFDGEISDVAYDEIRNQYLITYRNRRYISQLVDTNQVDATRCIGEALHQRCEFRHLGVGSSCSDGLDNDSDTLVDNADPDCYGPTGSESGTQPMPKLPGNTGMSQCHDGIDNDGDAFIDMLDPGCIISSDSSENPDYQPPTKGTCADGIDNDNDGQIDREDSSCHGPGDEEKDQSNDINTQPGPCADGIDNDGDGKIDKDDSACYGPWTESETAISRGFTKIAVDPTGKFAYVLEPEVSVFYTLALDELDNTENKASEINTTISAYGRYPLSQTSGIRVPRLALDITAATYTRDEFKIPESSKTFATRTRHVAYVSASNGSVSEYTILETINNLSTSQSDDSKKNASRFALEPTPMQNGSIFMSLVTCPFRSCTDIDRPEITWRTRPGIDFDAYTLTLKESVKGEPDSCRKVATEILPYSQRWRIAFEGQLLSKERRDGRITVDGHLDSQIDFCKLGVRKGDMLEIIPEKAGVSTVNIPDTDACRRFKYNPNNKGIVRLRWQIQELSANRLALSATGDDGDAIDVPNVACFGNQSLYFNIRANNEWLVTSNNVSLAAQHRVANRCVQRANFPPADRIPANATEAQNPYFSIKFPPSKKALTQLDAFEFSMTSGRRNLVFEAGPAPTFIQVISITNDEPWLFISNAGKNRVAVYDILERSEIDTI